MAWGIVMLIRWGALCTNCMPVARIGVEVILPTVPKGVLRT